MNLACFHHKKKMAIYLRIVIGFRQQCDQLKRHNTENQLCHCVKNIGHVLTVIFLKRSVATIILNILWQQHISSTNASQTMLPTRAFWSAPDTFRFISRGSRAYNTTWDKYNKPFRESEQAETWSYWACRLLHTENSKTSFSPIRKASTQDYGNCSFWPMHTFVCMVDVLWTIEHALWSIERVLWSKEHVLLSIEHVPWTIEHVIWSIEHVLWSIRSRHIARR